MQCTHINIRTATFILLSFLVNNIRITQTGNDMEIPTSKDRPQKNTTTRESDKSRNLIQRDTAMVCPLHKECSELHPPCIKCLYPSYTECIYGEVKNISCKVEPHVECKGDKKFFEKEFICRYCYQTEPWEHTCDLKANCNSVASPRAYYKTNCTVNDDVLCLGHRTFTKNVRCNWTGGYRWSTALLLSVTLGGFGADRFYLGHWQEGIGKLFSFGGLGVWTLIDVILISLHYLGPADGSLYI